MLVQSSEAQSAELGSAMNVLKYLEQSSRMMKCNEVSSAKHSVQIIVGGELLQRTQLSGALLQNILEELARQWN